VLSQCQGAKLSCINAAVAEDFGTNFFATCK
jgi:hypothetical protein